MKTTTQKYWKDKLIDNDYIIIVEKLSKNIYDVINLRGNEIYKSTITYEKLTRNYFPLNLN